MKIPKFGQPQNPDPYTIPQPGSENKKKSLLMFGGLGLLILILIMIVFGGGSPAGKTETLTAVTETGEAIGAIEAYERNLKTTPTKNDVARIKIILRGNYQSLGSMYKTTFDKKKSFTASPKVDSSSQRVLDAAVKNDTVDKALMAELQPKIIGAQRALIAMKASFSAPDSLQTISTAQTDYQAISDIIDKAN